MFYLTYKYLLEGFETVIDFNSVKLTFSSKNFRPLGKLGCNAKVCNALHNLVWINNKCISQNNSIHFLANTHSRKIRCKKTSNKFNQLCFKDRKSTKNTSFNLHFCPIRTYVLNISKIIFLMHFFRL